MKMWKRLLACTLSMAMIATLGLGGCGKEEEQTPAENPEVEESTPEPAEEPEEEVTEEEPVGDDFIKLALNVYYNDSDSNYFNNEVSTQSITVTKEGQYTLDFDCDRDLSDEAKSAGVSSLTNLTAIYILDSGVAEGAQSPLSACDILYDEITVDGTALTITQTAPKSAFKSSGVFDTNDPINAWDGSQVEEVDIDTENHVANFNSVSNPKTISVTFTLSGMVWGASEGGAGLDASEIEIIPTDYADLSAYTALEVSKMMGNGINLGNTMEAYGHTTFGTEAEVSVYETSWGQPVTTEAMIRGMRAAGFDTVRIPVAWTNKMAYETGDYTISQDLLDRVAQIVDWAIDAGMFVIVNEHWDGNWFGRFGSATQEVRDSAMEQYKAMWTQIAERFKDYPDNLIFESLNEELGNSLNGPDQAGSFSDPGSLSQDETYEVSNAINQAFVDTVRGTGGNNDDRFLLIAGMNTNFALTCDERFVMPKDSANQKLFVSVHYYDPTDYCLDKDANSVNKHWGTVREYKNMNDAYESIRKFVDAGYGVIIGEYGALKMPDGSLMYDTVNYHSNLLDNCDIYNYVPVLWDTGMFYDKSACVLRDQEVAELYRARTYAKEQEMGDEAWIAASRQHMEDQLAAAPETFNEGGAVEVSSGIPYAWIMWNGGAGTYSVGDVYNPNAEHPGIIPTDVVVDGAGEYTVGLEFEGGNDGLTFAALAVADGELLYPGCILDIKEIAVNGTAIHLTADPYTSSDDEKCTRVNLYNAWVNKLPDDARNASGDLSGASPEIVDLQDMNGVKTLTITFELIVP